MPPVKEIVVSSSSTHRQTLERRNSVPRADDGNEPAVLDDLESILVAVTSGVAVSAPMFPGFALCIPALAFLAVVVILPVVAVAALVTLAVAILAVPYLLVRSVRSIGLRRLAPAPGPVPRPAVDLHPTTPPQRRSVVT